AGPGGCGSLYAIKIEKCPGGVACPGNCVPTVQYERPPGWYEGVPSPGSTNCACWNHTPDGGEDAPVWRVYKVTLAQFEVSTVFSVFWIAPGDTDVMARSLIMIPAVAAGVPGAPAGPGSPCGPCWPCWFHVIGMASPVAGHVPVTLSFTAPEVGL